MKKLMIDLDGTMYHGTRMIERGNEFLKMLDQKGIEYLFLTNNASRTSKQAAEHMQHMGYLSVQPEMFYTSAMAAADEAYASVLKIVTVDVTVRVLRQSTEGDAMTQESQTGLGYSWSGSYAVPGGGIANSILNNDLKKLGLKRQQIGVMYLWQGSKESQ